MMRKNSMLLLAVLIAFGLSSNSASAQIIINEFMAYSTSTYPDMVDYDDFSDWIELYNPTSAEIDLKGYYLTDNLNNPTKWAFPDGAKIGAKEFFIVRADGADSKPGVLDTLDSYQWNIPFTTQRYHTNFKLSDAGDEIGLYKTSGTTTVALDSVIFMNQLADVSVGRHPTNNQWYKFDEPTPGSANSTDAKQVEAYSGSVTFSVAGGFHDGPQALTLTVSAGDIYYTTDGSIPMKSSARSTKYSSPLTVDKSTVIRARCIEPGKLAGKVTTNTYFIKEKLRSLMKVSITTDTAFIFNKDLGVFANSRKGREVPIAIEFFAPDGKQIAKVNAGMTIGSMTNFTCPQKPLQIALKGGKYGDDFVWYQLFDKPIASFERLRLRQGGDAWSTNLIADGVLEPMCKGQLELGVQAYRPVIVYINGQYYGIQDLREQFDDQYFTGNYNVDPSTKDEVRSTFAPVPGQTVETWELVDGSWNDYRALLALVKDGDMTDEKYAKVRDLVSINSLIDFRCAVVFGKQVSWGHNEDLWKSGATKWQWLCTDFDRCFVYKDELADIDHNNFTKKAGVSGSLMEQDTLFFNLMKNKNFKDYFAQRLAAHLNSTFKPARMMNIVDSLANMIQPEMTDYVAKWSAEKGAISSTQAWKAQVDTVKLFCQNRIAHIHRFLADTPFNYTGAALLNITLDSARGGEIRINGVRMCAGLQSMTFVKGVPMHLQAIAKPGFVFAGWKDGASTDTMTLTLTADTTGLTALFVRAEDHILPARIDSSLTLSLTDHPYIAPGDVVVAKGATLTIGKGVTLLMPQDADIDVKGRLVVSGTSDAPVTIKANSKDGATNWGALNFDSTAEMNTIIWATITGATLGNDALNERGGINGNYSNVTIDHLSMYNVIYPLYFEYGSNTTIKNSKIIVDHICNGAIHIGRGPALVENNIWHSTGVTMNTDAIDIKGVENGIIRGNLVYNFNGPNSDAIDLGESAKSILITNNIIYGSYDKGLSIGGKSTAIITNNLIVACDLGIGIKDDFSYAELDHNTFVRNRIAIATYAKAYGRGGGLAKVTNCILAASKAASIFEDRYSTIEVSHCISDVDILPGVGNVFGDPYFADLYKNNLQLDKFSPCINTGDPAYKKDADGSVTDIGAQYAFDSTDFPVSIVPHFAPPQLVISEIMYNDDGKTNTGDWIEFYNPGDKELPLGGWKFTDEGDYGFWLKSIDLAEVDSEDVYVFPDSVKVPAKGYLVVCSDLAQFKTVHGGVPAIGNLPFKFSDVENLLLYNEHDELVNALCYRNNAPWPTAPDGKGPSMELVHADRFNYHPLNWGASKSAGGTPGKDNSASPVIYRPSKSTVPLTCMLAQNFPNPCKTATTIQFALPAKDRVTISIYNISGRLLETIVDDRIDAGYHRIKWNAARYSAGVYFYRISTSRFVATKKLTIQ